MTAPSEGPEWVRHRVKRWAGSLRVAELSAEQRGVYHELIVLETIRGAWEWNLESLSRRTRLTIAELERSLPAIRDLGLIAPIGKGLWSNETAAEERQKAIETIGGRRRGALAAAESKRAAKLPGSSASSSATSSANRQHPQKEKEKEKEKDTERETPGGGVGEETSPPPAAPAPVARGRAKVKEWDRLILDPEFSDLIDGPKAAPLRDWVDHLAERLGKAHTKSGTRQALRRIKAMTPDQFRAAVEHSIGNNYQGLYEDRNRSRPSGPTGSILDHATVNGENAGDVVRRMMGGGQ